MPVRTANLGRLQGNVNGWAILCTVPAGQTFLVKEVRYHNSGGTTDTITIALVTPSIVIYALLNASSLAAGGVGSVLGWIAMAPGDTLQVFSTTGGTRFWASGTKLDGVAP